MYALLLYSLLYIDRVIPSKAPEIIVWIRSPIKPYHHTPSLYQTIENTKIVWILNNRLIVEFLISYVYFFTIKGFKYYSTVIGNVTSILVTPPASLIPLLGLFGTCLRITVKSPLLAELAFNVKLNPMGFPLESWSL